MLQAGMMQPVGDLLVIALALGMAAFGYRQGLFLATLSGLAVLASYVVALAVSGVAGDLVVSLGCPEPYALPAIYGLVLGVCLVGMRLLVGAAVPESAVRLPPLLDALGGAAVGAVAGMAAAGAALVGLSIAPVPADYRIDGGALKFDCGRMMLGTFAACLGADEPRRQELLRQYAEHTWHGQARGAAVDTPAAGPPADLPGQAPLIATPDEITLPAGLVDGGTLHQVRTVRQGDPITFALRPAQDTGGDFDLVVIDEQTGDITVPDVERLRSAGSSIDIVLTTKDQSGLTDEKTVTILLQP